MTVRAIFPNSCKRRAERQGLNAASAALCILAAALPSAASADVDINPFVSVRQVVNDSTGRSAGGWAEAGAGFALLLDTNRVEGRASYQYSHRFKQFGEPLTERGRHSGNAEVRTEVIDDFLTLTAGGAASQYASDLRGFNAINPDEDNGNQTQVFSGYIEPSVRQRLGSIAEFAGYYRLGAVAADSPRGGFQPGDIGLSPADGLGAQLSDSVTQTAGLSLGSTRATNTINWLFDAQATHEDIDDLDQRYRGYSIGGELGVRITRKLELLGRGGYEDIDNTQNTILFDPLTGEPVLDADGDLQVDPNMPRRTAFAFDGIYWSAGFRYTPSRRTTFEVRAGERYGAPNVFLDASHVSRNGMTVRANFQQTLNSFSRLLTQSINGVPISTRRFSGFDQLDVPFCIIGIDPQASDGSCLGGLTQSLTPATFKSDLAMLMVSRRVDALTWSATVYYDKRRYVDVEQLQVPGQPQLTPGLVGDDETYGLRGRILLNLGKSQTLGFDALASRNKYALSNNRTDTLITLGTQYTRRLNRHLSGNASLYGTKRFTDAGRDTTSFTASVGVRYNF